MATRRPKRPRDPIQLGKLIVDIATGQVQDRAEDDQLSNPRGRAGGLRGGVARKDRLDAERRQEIARTAAKARWDRDGKGDD
jgi:hypothetical protein